MIHESLERRVGDFEVSFALEKAGNIWIFDCFVVSLIEMVIC